MKLSDGEKLILFMLTEIMERLDVDSEFDPKIVRRMVGSGDLWALQWQYGGIPFDDRTEPPELADVCNILDTWDFVEMSYDQLPAGAKKEVEAANYGHAPHFNGFDGNNESEHMHIARVLIEDMGRWSRFKGRSLNSHSPSLSRHLTMAERFEPIRKALSGRVMTTKEIISLIEP